MQSSAEYGFGGHVEFDFKADGLEVAVDIPMDRVRLV